MARARPWKIPPRRGPGAPGLAVLILALGVATAACGGDTQAAPAARPPAPAVVPGVDLRPEDDVDALDCASDRRGALHLVWREVLAERPGGPRYRVRYARREAGGATWSGPETVVEAADPPPRLVLLGGSVHALAGPGLRHVVATGAGSGWRAAGELLEAGGPPTLSYAAAAVDGRLLAVSFAREGRGELVLDATLWDPADGAVTTRRLAEFPPSPFDPPAPALATSGGVTSLVAAVNGQVRRTVQENGRSAEVVSPRARLVWLASRDGGRSWTAPRELPPPREGPPSTVRDVDLVASPEGLLAFYAAHGVWAERLAAEPGLPVQIAVPERSALHGGTGARSVTAARTGAGAGALAWIDERFRKSDRRWWNPLGGWPWSDSPDWINNDVFSLSLAELEGAPASVAGLRPARQTAAGSYAADACLAAAGRDLDLVWTGRRRVGKTRGGLGASPEIFLRQLRPTP